MTGFKRSLTPNVIIAVLVLLLLAAVAVITNPSLLKYSSSNPIAEVHDDTPSLSQSANCPPARYQGSKVREKIVERIVYIEKTTEIPTTTEDKVSSYNIIITSFI